MTTQEREAIYEHCARLAETWHSALRPRTEARLHGHNEASREIAAIIREHAADPVKYP